MHDHSTCPQSQVNMHAQRIVSIRDRVTQIRDRVTQIRVRVNPPRRSVTLFDATCPLSNVHHALDLSRER